MIGFELQVMGCHPVHQTLPELPEGFEEVVEAQDDVDKGRNDGPEDGCVGPISDHGLPDAVEVELREVCVAIVQEHKLQVVHDDAGPGPQ